MKLRRYAPDRVGRHDTAQQPGDGPRRDPPPARRDEADRSGGDNDREGDPAHDAGAEGMRAVADPCPRR